MGPVATRRRDGGPGVWEVIRGQPTGAAGRKALVVGRLAVPVIVVACWAAAAAATTSIAGPWSTFRAVVTGFGEGWMLSAMWTTTRAVISGFAVAAAVGMVIGVVLGLHRFSREVLEPIINVFFAIPRVIIYPVVLAAFGVGGLSLSVVAGLAAVFPVITSTIAGVKGVSPTLVKAGRSTGATFGQLVRKIYLPGAAATIMTGVRLGFGVAVITVIIAELFASGGGLGFELGQAYALKQTTRVFAVVLVIGVLAVLVNIGLWYLEVRIRGVMD